jgi:hypothetical protein
VQCSADAVFLATQRPASNEAYLHHRCLQSDPFVDEKDFFLLQGSWKQLQWIQKNYKLFRFRPESSPTFQLKFRESMSHAPLPADNFKTLHQSASK